MAKESVAILGGGIAGLVTAFELTSDPDWKDKINKITLYQMGWRLGGKCASGRGGPMERIEEHGIHLFGGGYYNTLPLMQRCYDALRAGQGGWPFTFKMAFNQQYLSIGWDAANAGPPKRSPTDFPKSPISLKTLGDLISIRRWVLGMLQNWRELFFRGFGFDALGNVFLPEAGLKLMKFASPMMQGPDLINLLTEQIDQGMDNTHEGLGEVVSTVQTAQAWIQGLGEGHVQDAAGAVELMSLGSLTRNVIQIGDLALAIVHGILNDGVFQHGFDHLDSLDFRRWLARNGASQSTIESPIVMSTPNILYQYPGGDNRVRGNATMGAGCFLHWTLRTLAYVGSPFWFFGMGTGETVILPLYIELQRRGVEFKFFHKVTSLDPSSDGRRIEAVQIDIQAKATNGAYQPLRKGDGLMPRWPSRPLFDQLVDGDQLDNDRIDLESHWKTPLEPADRLTLRAGTDFTKLVFAISLGSVPFLCDKLMKDASKPWDAMVRALPTVQTQSFQMWLRRDSSALGMDLDRSRPTDTDDTALGCGFAAPFDGFVDFTPLIGAERWQAVQQSPKALWYFSDVLRHEPGNPPAPGTGPTYPDSRLQAVKTNARQFLDTQLARLLPNFTDADLVTHAAAPAFHQQYFRANIDPSELYVQSPPGSTAHRRLPWDTGYDNLLIAGDWTYNGLNVGCVEAAVMSGRLASHGITHFPRTDDIIGYFRGPAP